MYSEIHNHLPDAENQRGNHRANDTLQSFLDKRQSDLSIRTLSDKSHLVDFCSNDYLGFSRSALLRYKVEKGLQKAGNYPLGSTGSRLITGNHPLFEELEAFIADYHHAPAGLIFNSGYDANTGFFSSVPQQHDLVLYDELVHASIRDGLKLCRGKTVEFRHNDLEDLQEKMSGEFEHIYLAVESVYSMDGDFASLEKLAEICRKSGAKLVVDEAHATGLFGKKGEGRVVELGLEKEVFARVHTFSKALGCSGAIILGSETLKQFIINFARPFIFTTALSFPALIAIKCAYDILSNQQHRVLQISSLRHLLQQKIELLNPASLISGQGPVQSILLPGNERALKVSKHLESAGFYIKAILYPTVPRGKERIRIVLHSFNSEEEVLRLAEALNQFFISSKTEQ